MVRRILGGLTIALILMISAFHASAGTDGCGRPPHSIPNFDATETLNEVSTVPFYMDDGTERTLADFLGSPLVVNLWATWCAPCVREMPALDRLSAEVGGDGIRVLALSADRGGAPVVEKFYDDNGIRNLPVMIDRGGKLARSLNAPGLPMTVLVDAKGREIGRVVGEAEWDDAATIEFLRGCLTPGRGMDSARRPDVVETAADSAGRR